MLRGSLQRKLLAVVLLTTLVAVLFALGAMIGYDLRAYHRGWVDDLNAQAELLGRTTAPALEFDDARVARENLSLLRLQPGIRSAALYSRSGKRENVSQGMVEFEAALLAVHAQIDRHLARS
jgi:hypothetical protein